MVILCSERRLEPSVFRLHCPESSSSFHAGLWQYSWARECLDKLGHPLMSSCLSGALAHGSPWFLVQLPASRALCLPCPSTLLSQHLLCGLQRWRTGVFLLRQRVLLLAMRSPWLKETQWLDCVSVCLCVGGDARGKYKWKSQKWICHTFFALCNHHPIPEKEEPSV